MREGSLAGAVVRSVRTVGGVAGSLFTAVPHMLS